MTEFVYDAKLTVHAVDEQEAHRLAREARDFLNDPVLFGCLFVPGGRLAPPQLHLLEKRTSGPSPQEGDRSAIPGEEFIRIVFSTDEVLCWASDGDVDEALALERAREWAKHVEKTATQLCSEQLCSVVMTGQP